MAAIHLKVPVLVQNITVEEKSQYYLRPLFLSYPVATNRRFDLAISTLKKEVKQLFKGYQLSRESSSQLFWYLFNPDVDFRVNSMSFNLGGSQYINGLFGIAVFEVKGFTFVCLPMLNNYMFISSSNSAKQLNEEIQNALEKQLKKIKREQGEDFIPDIYYSTKKEFLTTIEVDVTIQDGIFKFGAKQENWFFSRMAPSTNFDGASEIEKVGYNLNTLFPSELNRAFCQDKIVEKIRQTLFQEKNVSIALVGPEGIGKHTVIHEAIYRKESETPDQKQSIWHLDPSRIISGMSIVGMWQKRFESIIEFVINVEGDQQWQDRLLIDNPVALLRIGKSAQNNMTLSDVLKPHLEKRKLQLTLIATNEEWKLIQEKDRRFSDLFQVFRLREPELEIATKMILKQRNLLELQNDTIITIQAVHELFSIHRNYLKTKALPGSIMKLMKQLAIKFRHQMVDAPEVREEFKLFSGLEKRIFDSGQSLEKDEVAKALNAELIGQPEAVEILTNVIHLIKARLNNPTKPFSSFLFIGPTGVGKTQAAKVLAQYLMGGEEHLLRFDMNEFIDELSIRRLIGDEYNPEGQLTGQVRYHPFSILLLDEIEKAHPKIHDLLLQVLDDGRLTDSLGRTVDFTNTIIIMTSNIGAKAAASQVGFGDTSEQEVAAIYRKQVEKAFRPEFINRIDQIAVFRSLELPHILRIARLQIRELLQRDGFVRRTTILNISKSALEWVARRGYDSKMGGRALRRQIEKDLTTLSAEQLLLSSSDNPIIFNIELKDDHLSPNITSLGFIDQLPDNWIPKLPDVNRGRKFYSQLLRTVEGLQLEIERYEEELGLDDNAMVSISQNSVNWHYYYFKNKVIEIKDHLQTNMLGFNDLAGVSVLPLRLKRGHHNPRKYAGSKGIRENLKDQLFQKEAIKELRDAYQFGKEQFDNLKSEFMSNYLNVAFLKLFARGFLEGRIDEVTLEFRSSITGMGNWEIGYLIDKYQQLFKELDLSYKVDKKSQTITTEGHALYDLIKGEAGIHLFYVAHNTPLPIKLEISKNNSPSSPQQSSKVIRIYAGSSTLTDLRTGLSNTANLNTNEFKFLLYAGIPASLRNGLLKV